MSALNPYFVAFLRANGLDESAHVSGEGNVLARRADGSTLHSWDFMRWVGDAWQQYAAGVGVTGQRPGGFATKHADAFEAWLSPITATEAAS